MPGPASRLGIALRLTHERGCGPPAAFPRAPSARDSLWRQAWLHRPGERARHLAARDYAMERKGKNTGFSNRTGSKVVPLRVGLTDPYESLGDVPRESGWRQRREEMASGLMAIQHRHSDVYAYKISVTSQSSSTGTHCKHSPYVSARPDTGSRNQNMPSFKP